MKRCFARAARRIVFAAAVLATSAAAYAESRFPQPDFTGGHRVLETAAPLPRAAWQDYADVGMLAATLSLASWLALRRRSRRGLFLLGLFSLAYFGFYRKGCICPVGSLQNIALALSGQGYAAPMVVVAFFALPLLFALFFGRVFCAAVCPLGAVQELVVFRPVKLPVWLTRALELLPHAYLGLAVLFAACGAGFIVCRFDPFVGFFRLDGPASMLIFGAILLVLGLVAGRPYCRFLCPYGVLLNWCSRLSRRHLGITPDQCIQCRLCESSCPYDAILAPTPPQVPGDPAVARRRLGRYLALLPALVLVGAGAGWLAGRPLARVQATVRLAEAIRAEDAAGTRDTAWPTRAFRAGGRASADLFREEQAVYARFAKGGALLGAFLGLVIGARLASLAAYRPRRDYEPDRGRCVSCGRCFSYCPREYVRLGLGDGPMFNP